MFLLETLNKNKYNNNNLSLNGLDKDRFYVYTRMTKNIKIARIKH